MSEGKALLGKVALVGVDLNTLLQYNQILKAMENGEVDYTKKSQSELVKFLNDLGSIELQELAKRLVVLKTIESMINKGVINEQSGKTEST